MKQKPLTPKQAARKRRSAKKGGAAAKKICGNQPIVLPRETGTVKKFGFK